MFPRQDISSKVTPPNDPSSQPESSAGSMDGDYRSVIDDLTLEIKALKKELRRCKKSGPSILDREKLFEVKVHGLPQEKKTELEAMLRDIALGVDVPLNASSLQKKETIPPNNRDIYPKSEIQHKHAPSPYPNLRRDDSAYNSISTEDKSFSTPFSPPTLRSTYLPNHQSQDREPELPRSLYGQHEFMTDNERKSLVVGRLEQLFTGRINGTDMSGKQPAQMTDITTAREPPTRRTEPTQETTPLSVERTPYFQRGEFNSRDHDSTSCLNVEQMEMEWLPNQRPTRACDLDPDRAQTPSENMKYLQHLGQLPPDSSHGQQVIQDVHLDTDGWVYLNLLCSLAQLHIINVTPDFVRSAVTKISTKLQLSPDGHKIRWRGESEDAMLGSHDSQKRPFADTIHDSENKRLQQEPSPLGTNDTHHDVSSKDMAKSKSQLDARVESFRYRPLFAQRESTVSSLSDMGYPAVIADGKDVSESGSGLNHSGDSAGRLQRREGAITYYSGVPFCTDLSGDPDDMLPVSRTPSSGQNPEISWQLSHFTQSPRRTTSGSLISYRPLSDRCQDLHQKPSAMDITKPQDITNSESEGTSDIELDLTWSGDQQYIEQQPLVPSGSGGVLPDDNFVVTVDTKRPKQDIPPQASKCQPNQSSEEIFLPQIKTPISHLVSEGSEIKPSPTIEIELLSVHIKKLTPLPLPPPAIFLPLSSTDDSTSGEMEDFSVEPLSSYS
ncbi:hypothetical protein NW762_003280 [Fusarium torreyae]|uniref:Frequency clock protein n=1 Tax=Fusarium torreyae TaxID=1237075 RepID=A0A9W8S7F0_9HYPO|nr:hypothetical protein NW762_003280 [Fusarium torreyae]